MNTVTHTSATPKIQPHALTRRDALASVGALALAATATQSLASDGDGSSLSEVDEAIAAHHAALLDVEVKYAPVDAMEDEVANQLRSKPIFVRLVGQSGTSITIPFQFGWSSLGSVFKQTRANLAALTGEAMNAAPDGIDLNDRFARITAFEAENIAALEQAEAQRDAMYGPDYPAIKQAYLDASDAEGDAWIRVLSACPRSMAEVRRKFAHLASDVCRDRFNVSNEEDIDLLFASLMRDEATSDAPGERGGDDA